MKRQQSTSGSSNGMVAVAALKAAAAFYDRLIS